MSKLKIIPTLIVGALMLFACQRTEIEAVKYNDSLIKNQIAVAKAVVDLSKTFKSADTVKMDEAYKRAIFVLDSAYNNVQQIGDFDSDSTFRHQLNKLLLTYKSALQNEYAQVIALYKLPKNQFDVAAMKQMEESVVTAYNSIQTAIENFGVEQKSFAQKYGFKVMSITPETTAQ